MWVPLKKKKLIQITWRRKQMAEWRGGDKFLFFIFFSLRFILRFTKILPPDFVGINTESALRDEGYA